jgi:hypothetical protein
MTAAGTANSIQHSMPALDRGMTGAPSAAPEDSAALFWECLEAMRQEIAVAMGAIESNSLQRLRESISNQEGLCSHLEILAVAAFRRGGELQSASSPVIGQIFQSSRKLQTIVLDYAALLRHSGRSIAVLAALCRCHLGAFAAPAGDGGCRRNSLGEG